MMNMETLSGSDSDSGSLKRFWRIRGYERISGSKKNMKVVRLGGKPKPFWKIRVTPKLRWRLKIVSPVKLLSKLRDAYINMMLDWAGSLIGSKVSMDHSGSVHGAYTAGVAAADDCRMYLSDRLGNLKLIHIASFRDEAVETMVPLQISRM